MATAPGISDAVLASPRRVPAKTKQGNFRLGDYLDVSLVSVTPITSDTTLTSENDMVVCDGTFTVTLPDITILGEEFIITNIGTGMITIDGNSSDTFYGELTIECISNATLALRSATDSTWVLN